MASLIAFGVALQLLAMPAQTAGPAEVAEVTEAAKRWHLLTAEAARKFALPEHWVRGVLHAESGGHAFRQGRAIRSPKGAIGLMQLMPVTWGDMRDRLRLGHNPDDPHDNIIAGAGYLRLLYDRFGYPGLFAAYNMGPRRYADYLAGRGQLPRETIAYLDRGLGLSTAAIPRPSVGAHDALFVARGPLGNAATPLPTTLFVILKEGQ